MDPLDYGFATDEEDEFSSPKAEKKKKGKLPDSTEELSSKRAVQDYSMYEESKVAKLILMNLDFFQQAINEEGKSFGKYRIYAAFLGTGRSPKNLKSHFQKVLRDPWKKSKREGSNLTNILDLNILKPFVPSYLAKRRPGQITPSFSRHRPDQITPSGSRQRPDHELLQSNMIKYEHPYDKDERAYEPVAFLDNIFPFSNRKKAVGYDSFEQGPDNGAQMFREVKNYWKHYSDEKRDNPQQLVGKITGETISHILNSRKMNERNLDLTRFERGDKGPALNRLLQKKTAFQTKP